MERFARLGVIDEDLSGRKLLAVLVGKRVHHIHILVAPMRSTSLKGPPRKGGNPMPNTAPMSPSTGIIDDSVLQAHSRLIDKAA